jgi:hypothetical protein
MPRQHSHTEDLARPAPAPESGKAPLKKSSQPQSTVAFRLGLASLAVFLFGCMTVTRLVTGASSTPAQPGAGPTPPSQLPVFEHDYNKTLTLIGSGQAQRLVELSAEGQQPPMYQAGTQKYTVNMAGSEIVDLGYDWCAKTGPILSDNTQHITVSVTINGYEIPAQDLQAIDWSVQPGQDAQFPEGLVCHSWVVLASNWPAGDYQITEVATFDTGINDGYDDYGAGAYTYEYMVHVGGTGPSANGPEHGLFSWGGASPVGLWKGLHT